jgi:DivIVA domain-containing protein
VTTALIYLVVMVLVAAVIYLLASAVFGRGEELAPLPPGASPTRLPADDATGDDIRSVRFQQVFRGYKMSEVDWVLSRLSDEVDTLRTRLAELAGTPVPVTADRFDTADRLDTERFDGDRLDPTEHPAEPSDG